MKHGLYLFFAACILTLSAAWAGPVDQNQARAVARNFLASHARPTADLKLLKKAPGSKASDVDAKAAYYVFGGERENSGFVIVAGDDRAPAVLGYSDSGKFDARDVPPALQELLDDYAAQMQELESGGEPRAIITSRPPVAPLLSCEWAQQEPYKLMMPFIDEDYQPVTGCVATAMAQVMYYWKWPLQTTAIPEYVTESDSIEVPGLMPAEFDWDLMQDSYFTSDSTSESAWEVAKLMRYCAQAMEMNFSYLGSGAVTAYMPLALSTYFGYSPNVHMLNRINFTAQEWEDSIYAELRAARPIIFSGRKAVSGHAFVCDGCDGEGMYHINWGWNGKSNGYYLLDVLNPSIQGTGSAGGSYGYIGSQAIIVGIQPGNGNCDDVVLTSAFLELNSHIDTRASTSDNFMARVSGRYYNYTSQQFSVDQGWALYQGDELVSLIIDSCFTDMMPGYYIYGNKDTLEFGSGITSGTYRLMPVYSECETPNWRPCVGAERHAIDVTIDGNSCSFAGHGSTATPDYRVDSVVFHGTKHPKRPLDITVYLTNNGESFNDVFYLYVNSQSESRAYVSIPKGESGAVTFRYTPSSAGIYTFAFTFYSTGKDPNEICMIIVDDMPESNLKGHVNVLNVTSPQNKTILSDKFSVRLHVTNMSSTPYNEDITVELNKITHDNYGTAIHRMSRHLNLAPYKSTTIQFDFDDVVDGWSYFLLAYCYGAGGEKTLAATTTYTMQFPDQQDVLTGDVDDDGLVTIADVTDLINYLLTDDATGINLATADCDADGKVDIEDATALINFLLLGTW